MGVNALGYFVTKRELTDEEIAQVLDDFYRTYYDDFEITFHSLRNNEDMSPRCVEINFEFDRLYSSGYARGNAVKHITVLGWLRRRPYVEAVFYGGDSGELGDICEWTEEVERETINLYLTSNTLTYHQKEAQRKWFTISESTKEPE